MARLVRPTAAYDPKTLPLYVDLPITLRSSSGGYCVYLMPSEAMDLARELLNAVVASQQSHAPSEG
jgi:hypothetical protein